MTRPDFYTEATLSLKPEVLGEFLERIPNESCTLPFGECELEPKYQPDFDGKFIILNGKWITPDPTHDYEASIIIRHKGFALKLNRLFDRIFRSAETDKQTIYADTTIVGWPRNTNTTDLPDDLVA